MSDTKLTVSLVLNDASFTKQLSQINKDIKLTESEFKNASSGVDNFGNTLNGIQTKMKSLTSQIESQSQKIELYKQEIQKTTTKLEELTQSHSEQSTKLTSLRQKYDEVCATMGENSDEAKKLNEEIKSLEKSNSNLENKIVSTNARLTTLNTGLNESEAEFKKLDSEISKTTTSLDNFNTDQVKKKLESMSSSLESTSNKLGSIGKGFNEVSSVLSKISLPLAAGLGYATKVTADFEQAMSVVQSVSDVSADDLDRLGQKARELGASTTKSAAEAADALGYMGLAGWNTEQMLAGLEPVLKLSEAGALDLGLASDLVTDSMGSMKLQVSDLGTYLDTVALASVQTNSDIQDLLEAFINTGSTVSNLKIPLTEANAALGILANNGTKGYEAGTKLNSILTRMTAQSKPAIAAWNSIGVSVFDTEGNFRGLTTVLAETREKFNSLTQEQQQYFLKSVAGTDNINDFVNLMYSADGTIQNLTETLKDSDGELLKIANTMQDNIKGSWSDFSGKVEELGIKFGEVLLPTLEKLLEKLGDFVDWFGTLSPATKEAIVKTALFTLAVNGATKGLGGFFESASSIVSVSSKLVGAFSKTAGATASVAAGTTALSGSAALGTGLMGAAASFGSLALAALPWVAGAAAVGAAGYAVYKGLNEEVTPAVDLFADQLVAVGGTMDATGQQVAQATQYMTLTISEETQKAVQAYIDLDDAAYENLTNLFINSQVITEETKNTVVGNFTELGNMVKTQLDTNMQESIQTMTTFFETSSVMTDEYEASILEKNNAYYEQKKADIDSYEQQISEILTNASESNRQLTVDEVNTITELRNKMREESVKAYSQTEEETNLILGRLASYDGRITAEIASKHIQEAEKTRLESVDAATKEYEERVRQIEFMRDDSKVISEEQAQALIDEAERQKNGAVEKAGEMKKKVVSKLQEMNGNILDEVDEASGKIMTFGDKVATWWNNLWFGKKTLEVETNETKNVRYNQIGERMSGATIYSADSDSSVNPYSIATLSEPGIITDSLEVPNARSYMNETVSSITASSKESNASDIVYAMKMNLQEMQKQNNLLLTLLSVMQQEKDVNVGISIDGKQIAKATAQYINKEIENINTRKNRLGGVY